MACTVIERLVPRLQCDPVRRIVDEQVRRRERGHRDVFGLRARPVDRNLVEACDGEGDVAPAEITTVRGIRLSVAFDDES